MIALLLTLALADEPATVAVEATEAAPAHLALPDGADLWVSWPAVLTTERRWRRCVELAEHEPMQVEALTACRAQLDVDGRLVAMGEQVVREQARALKAERAARVRLWLAVGLGCAAAAAGAVAVGVGL